MQPDPFADLIDFTKPFANIGGVPLGLTLLEDELIVTITAIHARIRAQRALADYAAFTIDVVPALHHRAICSAINALLNDEYDDLVVNTPPGAAKSTYTSHALGAYFLGTRPSANVIVATHTAELSERWSRKVRNTLASDEHALVFPASTLSKDSTAVGRWATSAGGEFLAAGVGGSILGFRADLAIIDDPISGFEQAQSETQLQKVHDWYETDLITRLKPGGKVVLICQRLAANDLAGYMIARNEMNPTRRIKVLTLRMEAEEDDPIGRAPGERLWPEWFTPEMVEDAKRDDYKWRTLYQQRPPSSSGDWVAPEHIKVVDIVPATLSRYLLSDLALSVNKGDYSVHIVAGQDEEGMVFIEDAWRERCAVERTVERHLDLIEHHRPLESLIDDDNASKVYVQFLAARARERGVAVPWRTMPMRGQDKETRAAPLRGMLRTGRVCFKRAPWNSWLFKEMMMFPNAMGEGVDDGVDALSLIGRRLASLARPGRTLPPPPTLTTQDMTLGQLFEDNERKRGFRGARI